MFKFFDSQLFAAIVGAAIAFVGTFVAQCAVRKSEQAKQRQAALEELLVAVKRYQLGQRKRFESFLIYKYQRLFTSYLDTTGKGSGVSTVEVHRDEAREALHMTNIATEECRQANTELIRYTSRLAALFPKKVQEIHDAVTDAIAYAEWSHDISGKFDDYAASIAFTKESHEKLAAFKKNQSAKFDFFQRYIINLMAERR